MTQATIYHNPKCGTSRMTLEALQARGVDVTVIEYLKIPPSAEDLTSLLARMGVSARDVLRRRGTPYDELGLDDSKWSEADLIGFIAAHPILLERPIVVTDKGAALCRPKDRIEPSLDNLF